jgi:hypothetical protein
VLHNVPVVWSVGELTANSVIPGYDIAKNTK